MCETESVRSRNDLRIGDPMGTPDGRTSRGTDISNQVSPHPRRVIPWSHVRSTPDSLRSPPRIPCPGADVRELLPLGELLTLCVWIVPAISAENHAVELPIASFRDLEER